MSLKEIDNWTAVLHENEFNQFAILIVLLAILRWHFANFTTLASAVGGWRQI
jgi:hypothetical protein